MRFVSIGIVGAVLLASPSARGEPALDGNAGGPGWARTETRPPRLVSPVVAALLSLGSTIAPVAAGGIVMKYHAPAGFAVLSSGLAVGPAIGHVYARRPGRALLLLGLRGGLLAASGALLLADVDAATCTNIGCGMQRASAYILRVILATLLLLPVAGLTVYDLIDAPSAAKRTNREIEKRWQSLSISPVITRTSSNQAHYGLAATVRF